MRLLFIISLAFSFNIAKAYDFQNQQFESQSSQVYLIELYTSEGCSSCPPAEHWLNELQTEKNLWKDFVPIAFHVDYWDYIGWRDIYAKPEHTERQRMYALENREQSVYTPGVRAEGREWRKWHLANLGKLADVEREDVGVLTVDVSDDGTFKADFNLAEGQTFEQLDVKGEPHFLTVALLGVGISTDVKHGENRGRKLDHDFVVLNSQDYEVNNSSWQGTLPVSKLEAPQYALAAWISGSKNLKPIQVVGGYLK